MNFREAQKSSKGHITLDEWKRKLECLNWKIRVSDITEEIIN